jgi:hypothetical protein
MSKKKLRGVYSEAIYPQNTQIDYVSPLSYIARKLINKVPYHNIT